MTTVPLGTFIMISDTYVTSYTRSVVKHCIEYSYQSQWRSDRTNIIDGAAV